MDSRAAVLLATSVGGLAVALAAFSAPNAPVADPQPAMTGAQLTQAKALYSEKCSACHDLPDPQEKDFTRAEWQRTVNRMLIQHHASDSISPPQAAEIVDYLSTFAPSAASQQNNIMNQWDTDQLDVWTTEPTTSHAYNFESHSALTKFSELSGGAAGPPAVWNLVREDTSPDGTAAQVRLVKPNPSRFALLMDRTDQGKDIDVSVRFHIVDGKISPAVGIVFGFSTDKSYTVLLYSQARQTLSLVQVDNGVHTTLQETPIVIPTSSTTATVVPPQPISGWHVLRVLVNNGQVHGWFDRTKRINIADPSYQGGKVGLWAQGDTVAAFDDWTVDMYDNAVPSADQPGA